MTRRSDQMSRLLSLVLDGEASRRQTRRVRRHVSRCRSCAASLRGWAQIDRVLAQSPQRLVPEPIIVGARDPRARRLRLVVAMIALLGTAGGALAWRGQRTPAPARPMPPITSHRPIPTVQPTREERPTPTQRPDASQHSTPTREPRSEALTCEPGRNGGATDIGVTADRIKLATTTVQSGRGASFLGEQKYAMEAVKNRVNRAGGICGRLLDIRYVDDGWDAGRGANYIRNFINDDVFAIAVGASTPGLHAAIKSGDIDKARIPVVGTGGMVLVEYGSPWVWPVAVADVSQARIMARNAYNRGAREFSIVFDRDDPFGSEAAVAYNAEVTRLTGQPVDGYNHDANCDRSYCGIAAGQASYSTDVRQFEPADYVALFLQPSTALTWMSTAGAARARDVPQGIGAAQPMFTRDFAENCRSACDGMWIWTGYRPPIPGPANEPDADPYNSYTQATYLGMTLLVEALQRVGPDLTRQRLRNTLDSMTLQTPLTYGTLTWTEGDHFANRTMRAFEIQYGVTFEGWQQRDTQRDAGTH